MVTAFLIEVFTNLVTVCQCYP